MNITPENQEKINAVLSYLLDSVQKVGDVAADQLPIVAQEIALWGFWSNAITYAILLLINVVLWSIIAGCLVTNGTLFDRDCPSRKGLVAIVCAVMAFYFGIGLSSETLMAKGCMRSAVKAYAAPRVYVLDWLREAL